MCSSSLTLSPLATFYDPNGGYGACGKKLNNNDMIVALSSDRYQNGAHCTSSLAYMVVSSLTIYLM